MLVTDDQTHAYLENSQVATGASEVWAAIGGDIIIAGDFRHLWKSVIHVHGIKDPTPDDATLEEKIRCRRQAFQEFLLSFTSRETLIEALDAANLAWGGVFDTDHFLSHSETLKHRNSIAEIDNREGGTRPTFQSPYRFSEAKSGVHRCAARLGEHNQEILAEWLGFSSEQAQDLAAKGAIAAETELN
jgi:crotonobetainyl-CoA:carnitine CoA-transferase CaiB-like acyl-CoA transferase